MDIQFLVLDEFMLPIVILSSSIVLKFPRISELSEFGLMGSLCVPMYILQSPKYIVFVVFVPMITFEPKLIPWVLNLP